MWIYKWQKYFPGTKDLQISWEAEPKLLKLKLTQKMQIVTVLIDYGATISSSSCPVSVYTEFVFLFSLSEYDVNHLSFRATEYIC